MVFISPVFALVFLPATLALYMPVYLTRKTAARNLVLLFYSLVFYPRGGVKYTTLLMISIVVNCVFGRLLEGEKHRKAVLVLSVAYNVGALFVFRCSSFSMDTTANIAQVLHMDWSVAMSAITLPIGISFFTFQTTSYAFDVYLKEVKTQKNILNLTLYITLFPQLITGPVARYIDVNQEIRERHMDGTMIHDGISRSIIGFNKKIFPANGMGHMVDAVLAKVNEVNTSHAWLGAVCYALQIYVDFSSYLDMAMGLGRLFGFHFLKSFSYPYISGNIWEFWGRWHISLSSWFRDYVYIPLGGSRKDTKETYRNLLIVFMLTGFWYGASWASVIWEPYHKFLLVIERGRFGRRLRRISGIFKRVYTLVVVLAGWVFFRYETIGEAFTYLRAMFFFQFGHYNVLGILERMDREFRFLLLLSAIGSLSFLPKLREKVGDNQTVGLATDIGLAMLFVCVVSYMVGADFNPFIYFRLWWERRDLAFMQYSCDFTLQIGGFGLE